MSFLIKEIPIKDHLLILNYLKDISIKQTAKKYGIGPDLFLKNVNHRFYAKKEHLEKNPKFLKAVLKVAKKS